MPSSITSSTLIASRIPHADAVRTLQITSNSKKLEILKANAIVPFLQQEEVEETFVVAFCLVSNEAESLC